MNRLFKSALRNDQVCPLRRGVGGIVFMVDFRPFGSGLSLLSGLVLSLICTWSISPSHAANPSSTETLQVEMERPIHPILIRNDYNTLVKIKIRASQKDTFLHSLKFSLRGTDDLKDIDSLQMFSTGDQEQFSTTSHFGDAQSPSLDVTFRGSFRLRLGDNLFWLSCRLTEKASLDHRIDASCVRIETQKEVVIPRDTKPRFQNRIGVALRRHFDDGIHTYRIPVLATTTQGTLLVAYDARRRRSRDLQEDIDIGLLRSVNGGQTWEPQRIIMDMHEFGGLPQEQNGCSDPGIIVDPATGEIFVFAVWTWGRPGTHQWLVGGSDPGFEVGTTSQFMMVRSQDDGKTWTEPVNLTRKLKLEKWILFVPAPQQGTALEDGTLVMPVQGRDEQDRHFSTIMLSSDHGTTWSVQTPYPHNNTECQAARLDNGSIMLNCRNDSSKTFRTIIVTSDLGKTWQPHPTSDNTLIEPSCNGSLYRFEWLREDKTQSLFVFANPHSQAGRTHQTIQVSLDEGNTWPKEYHLLLDEGRGKGYPSVSRIDGQHLGIVYEGSQADLHFERISLDELMTGQRR